ncbi:tetratricopeptide repeat protein [Methanobrevibacter sp.]
MLGNFNEALDCYNKSLKIEPSNVNVLNDKGWALGKIGRLKKV